jgi:glutamate-5-semialdehyde dehydrogenase
VACPIGVIGVIFESRPDALVQIASLCLKSGNAVLLKGGREAVRTNRALFAALAEGCESAGIPQGWAGLLESREEVAEMLRLDAYIDLIIPRGSNGFVRHIMENSRIPVLGHADGLCAVYVDRAANIGMAVRVAVDSKAQYVAVCNAAETLLVHKEIAPKTLPALARAMAEAGVRLKGCARTRALIACEAADDADYDAEFLDYVMAVRVVDTLEEAVAHINAHGSGHTDCIVTDDAEAARAFLTLVDSAGVYHNCSTRFADGFRYGLGAEVGVATGKLHARGPMGLEGLCTYKYKLLGDGHTVAEFAEGTRQFTHRQLEM